MTLCFFLARRFAFLLAALLVGAIASAPGGRFDVVDLLAEIDPGLIFPPTSDWSLARLKEAFGAVVIPLLLKCGGMYPLDFVG